MYTAHYTVYMCKAHEIHYILICSYKIIKLNYKLFHLYHTLIMCDNNNKINKNKTKKMSKYFFVRQNISPTIVWPWTIRRKLRIHQKSNSKQSRVNYAKFIFFRKIILFNVIGFVYLFIFQCIFQFFVVFTSIKLNKITQKEKIKTYWAQNTSPRGTNNTNIANESYKDEYSKYTPCHFNSHSWHISAPRNGVFCFVHRIFVWVLSTYYTYSYRQISMDSIDSKCFLI